MLGCGAKTTDPATTPTVAQRQAFLPPFNFFGTARLIEFGMLVDTTTPNSINLDAFHKKLPCSNLRPNLPRLPWLLSCPFQGERFPTRRADG
jgi:hypothetical protein